MRDTDVMLDDGGTIHLRSVEPGDAPALVALHGRFSERTRYLRFFGAYPRIPSRDLRRFANVDHRDREAFVALADGDIIAVGRYERLAPGGPTAEVAFVVEDAHQGRGIAPVLLDQLTSVARDVGIERFVADVLPGNSAMLQVFAEAGHPVESRLADGVIHVEFPIDGGHGHVDATDSP